MSIDVDVDLQDVDEYKRIGNCCGEHGKDLQHSYNPLEGISYDVRFSLSAAS